MSQYTRLCVKLNDPFSVLSLLTNLNVLQNYRSALFHEILFVIVTDQKLLHSTSFVNFTRHYIILLYFNRLQNVVITCKYERFTSSYITCTTPCAVLT